MLSNKNLNLEELKVLVFEQNQVNKQNKDKLFKLAKAVKDIECIKKLRDDFAFKGAKIYLDKIDKLSVNDAIKNRDFELFQKLVENDADISNINVADLIDKKYDDEFIKLFIQKGYCVNIAQLIKNDYYLETIKLALDKDANNNEKSILFLKEIGYKFLATSIHHAISKRKIELLKLLLEYKLDINENKNKNKITPLILGVLKENFIIIELLISKKNDLKLNLELTEKGEYTALLTACELKYTKIAKLLINSGANINAYSSYCGQAPITLAVENNDIELLNKLIEKKVNVNIQNNKGATPLFLAVDKKDKKITEILLKAEANVNIVNNDGLNITDLSIDRIDPDIFEILLKFNAPVATVTKHDVMEKEKISINSDYFKKDEYSIKGNYLKRLKLISPIKDGNSHIDLFDDGFRQSTNSLFGPRTTYSYKKIGINKYYNKIHTVYITENRVVDFTTSGVRVDAYEIIDDFSATYLEEKHNPQKLVKLLENFTIDTPIKCTTHPWEGNCESCKEMDFDDFIDKVQDQWNGIKDELKELSFNLHEKIEAFFFAKSKEKWCKDTGLDLGWSNLNGLKEHCNNGGKPFEFVLEKPISLENETITTFKELVNRFKEKIEVRNNDNMLKSIFVNFRKKLKKDAIKVKLCPSLEGVDFYTNVEKFKSALELIFVGIIAKKSDSDTVEIKLKKPNTKSVEIHIIHKGSCSNRTKEEMLKEVDSGELEWIKDALANLCDWSVEDKFKDKSYRVNYLKSNNIKDIEELEHEITGFTNILRFYK